MATSKKYLMAAAGGAGGEVGDYWINLGGGTGNDYYRGVAVDSLDNIISAGYSYSDGAGGADLLVSKYDSSGALLWERLLGGTSNDVGFGVVIDSSDNIIVAGYTVSDFLIAKYNSSGTLQWQRSLGAGVTDRADAIALDSSDNIIVTGRTNSTGAGGYDILIAKYNSSGTLQWQRTLGGTGGDFCNGVTVDSSNNIIVSGYTDSDGAGDDDILIAKYNSSGTLQWQRTLGGTVRDRGEGVVVDSSDNIIITGRTGSDGAGDDDLLLAKYNSSGTLQWQRTLGGTNLDAGLQVTLDSSDNIIMTGFTLSDGAGSYDILIAKCNSSGTLLWDRTLGGSANDIAYGLAIDSSDNIIVGGYSLSDGAGNYDHILVKLPPDGSLEGTYGAFTYADAVLTDAAASLTDSAASLTDSAASLTDATPTLTETKLYTLYTIS